MDPNTAISSVHLHAHLVKAINTVKELLRQIKELEANTQMLAIEKLSEIKKIREELNKVGTEIDNIKREIKLLDSYRLN
jgi:uncharacterized protein Yka (UPF0111/DUF47 family)